MNHPIPTEALAHHIAFLGKTGSGKSNAAKVVVEHLLDAGERVCIVDPTGAWYGLRLKADGKPSPYPVVIFGGLHADVQIGRSHGAAIGEVIASSSTPAVIDTRLMTVGERTEFFTAFAQTLLRKNRGPLHLVIDEAHVFAPQGRVADPRSGEMLHAANNLVSLGRSIGLRIMMISQRPAKLHKDSLTQVETLVAMRLIAPQDRAAVDAWIGDSADPAKGREIASSLQSLPTGDAWVWSPEIGFLSREHFPLARTYDSGKAPVGIDDGPVLQPIDLEAVNAQLEHAAADIKANDPKALKAEVARLARELTKAKPAADAPSQEAVDAAYRRGKVDGYAEGVKAAQGSVTPVLAALEPLERAIAALKGEAPKAEAWAKRKPSGPPSPLPAPLATTAAAGVTVPQQKVLNALAWWKAFGIDQPTNEQVGFIAGYSPSSGGFANLKGGLRSLGLVEYPAGGRLALTDAGADKAEGPTLAVTRDAFHAQVRAKLSGPQWKVLAPIIAAYPSAITSQEVAGIADYSAGSGGFANLRGSLRTIGLIDYPAAGQVRAADWLFPGGSVQSARNAG